jgi:hypothetical protein
MLRALVLLLLLANGVFYGWGEGWFEPLWPRPRAGEREPERLAAQVNADRVVVLPPAAASAVISAARAVPPSCLESGPLTEADVAAAEAALAQAGVPDSAWTREPQPPPLMWLLYAGRWPDEALRTKRIGELRAMKLNVETLDAPAELAPGLVLSRHATREAAEAAQTAVTEQVGRPLTSVRVVTLPTVPPPLFVLRAPRVDADQRKAMLALTMTPAGSAFKLCEVRP